MPVTSPITGIFYWQTREIKAKFNTKITLILRLKTINSFTSRIATKAILISYLLLSGLAIAHDESSYTKTAQDNKIIFGTTNAQNTQFFQRAERILGAAFAKLGYQFSLVNLPNKRNLLWANEDKIDGIAFRIGHLAGIYPNLIKVDEALFTIKQWVYSREKISIDGWQSLYPYTLAYEQGTLFIEQNQHHFQQVIPVVSSEKAFAMIEKKRADITITSQSTGDTLLNQYLSTYKGKIKRQTPALVEISLYSYFHRKHEILSVALSEQLKVMKANGEYQRLFEQVK